MNHSLLSITRSFVINSLQTLALAALSLCLTHATVSYQDKQLSNGIISVSFDEEGSFSIHDAKSNEALLTDSRFWLPRGERGKIVDMEREVEFQQDKYQFEHEGK